MSRYVPPSSVGHLQPSFSNNTPRHEETERSSSGGDPEDDVEKVDEDNSLTTQTLNADGTPKRPMNAFMIFARRRRPQVSAENQQMRTGEISKILSREWGAMAGADKQFYLDQAKQLKDTFNARYPDYVYRRRPNNSRKRRRAGDTGGAGRVEESPGIEDEDIVSSNDLLSSRDYAGGRESYAGGRDYSHHSHSAARMLSQPYPSSAPASSGDLAAYRSGSGSGYAQRPPVYQPSASTSSSTSYPPYDAWDHHNQSNARATPSSSSSSSAATAMGWSRPPPAASVSPPFPFHVGLPSAPTPPPPPQPRYYPASYESSYLSSSSGSGSGSGRDPSMFTLPPPAPPQSSSSTAASSQQQRYASQSQQGYWKNPEHH